MGNWKGRREKWKKVRKHFFNNFILIPSVVTGAVGANKIDKNMFVMQRFSDGTGRNFAGNGYYF